MKTMKNFLSMAALALMGAMMTGCSSDDNFDNPQQPENKSNVVTLTTTVGLDGGATTRALTPAGVKTFAVGETMAVIYYNGTSTVKAVSHALEAGDITDGGKKATFTFDLETPNKSGDVLYIYPAAMADDTGVDVTKLNTQEGTFDALQSKYDLCTNFGAWDGENLPSLTLENLLAILAINLKNEDGSSDITNTITSMVVSDGANAYTVNRTAAEGPIYVAILPTSGATINVTATDGSKNYTKTLTTKTYEAGNGYSVSWRMALENITWNSSKVAGIIITDDDPDGNSFESDGITVAVSVREEGSYFITSDMFISDVDDYFTFTSSVGNIKKIEINYTGDVSWNDPSDGWSLGAGTFTWEGDDPATSVTLSSSGNSNIDGITSIVFTLE